MHLTFATRPSALARWQTNHVADLLRRAHPGLEVRVEVIVTQGDRILDKPLPAIGGKGLFTAELEAALRAGRVDAAVHSLKDLPVEDAPGLVIGLTPPRADVRDALICPGGWTLDELPSGAVVGTSSPRRQAQLLAYRPDLVVKPIRGNVDTRIRKAREGLYDAVVLAAAGVMRLGLEEVVTQYLPLEVMLPAPGQGVLGVQCRADDDRTRSLLAAVEDPTARAAAQAERAFLAGLGGGCSIPVAAYAESVANGLRLRGLVASPDGARLLRVEAVGDEPLALGQRLAEEALTRGAADILSNQSSVTSNLSST
ncbi:MAG TPA: hydroxymethylbilane synthase [Anaerolineae bacterium]|nr:hydroxymethylbilane synthase [Anaerolineae bacterium]